MREKSKSANFAFYLLFYFLRGDDMSGRNIKKLERKFQSSLIRELKRIFEDSIILKLPANYKQGIPDLLILYKDKWATLECKRSASAKLRPNQRYYVEKLNSMSFSRIIFPDNKEDVLHELKVFFQQSRRP